MREALVKGRVVRRVEDLDDATVKAVAEAEVPAKYAHLDEELKSPPCGTGGGD